MDYKSTLNMPKTEFAMRGNLGVREVDFQKHWEDINLYEKVLKKHQDEVPFVLHDGPPYANGDIHIGHALNKILKDFVLRYRTMKGHYVRYIPGWDTHGLPIETALTKKGVKRKEMTLAEYRELCYQYAEQQVNRQKDQFKRLGILGEWDHPYITYTGDYEARQIRLFAKMVKRGLIYKGLKPVFWSPSSESALAEAEIEYADKQSISIYVAFPSVDGKGLLEDVSYLIWTTTPWTIPANLAISVHPLFKYAVVKANDKKYVVAETLVEKLSKILNWEHIEVLGLIKGSELEHQTYKHPIYERISPIIVGDHVTDSDGTGLVHTAPGHGEDDYRVGKLYNLDILCPVDDQGMMTKEAGPFAGLFYEVANEKVVESLESLGALLKKEKFMHSYPHDWRTQKPVIFRATPQWFASIDKLKEELLDEVKKIDWLPLWGEVRISNMNEGREDWCISRQRAWGVPIPVFYAENHEAILDQDVLEHVASLFEKMGSNIWYLKEAKDLLPEGYKHPGSPNGIFKKESDIMDVWFDSGTSHSLLEARGLNYPADLYLEGSDQYRGWFNSSLITGVAALGESPYKRVVSHGFVLDGQGRKMSKSLGNTVDPLAIMKQQGADLLRLWVATVDYQSDVRISNEMMTQIAEGYRKIRNTFRFMLGNLDGFDPKVNYVKLEDRLPIHKVMTEVYHDISNQILDAYENYQFDKVYRIVVPFMINELSAFYLDFTKDILYIEKEDQKERRMVQSVIYDITMGLLKLLTPIIPHTTSEAYNILPFTHEEDVYLEYMPKVYKDFDKNLMKDFNHFMEIRELILKKLEDAREQKLIGKSLQAKLDLKLLKEDVDTISRLHLNLHQILIVSSVEIQVSDKRDIQVHVADGHVCERCWNIFSSVHEDGLCDRCHDVIGGK